MAEGCPLLIAKVGPPMPPNFQGPGTVGDRPAARREFRFVRLWLEPRVCQRSASFLGAIGRRWPHVQRIVRVVFALGTVFRSTVAESRRLRPPRRKACLPMTHELGAVVKNLNC